MISFEKLDSFLKSFNSLPLIIERIDDSFIETYNQEILKANEDQSSIDSEIDDEGFYINVDLVDSSGYLLNSKKTRELRSHYNLSDLEVSTEIESNLFILTNEESRKIYAKKILKKFKTIELYLNTDYETIYSGNEFFVSRKEELLIEKSNKILRLFLNIAERLHSGNYNLDNKKFISIDFVELINLYNKFIVFTRDLCRLLFSFHINPWELGEETSVFIFYKISGLNPSITLRLMGFTYEEIQKYYYTSTEDSKPPNTLESQRSGDHIINLEQAINLRKKFDGFLWEKEQISDEEFLEYWIIGDKAKTLPIKSRQTSSFLYLYFGYINQTNKNNHFAVGHDFTEGSFGIKDVKGKKAKISAAAEGARYIRKVLGAPIYRL